MRRLVITRALILTLGAPLAAMGDDLFDGGAAGGLYERGNTYQRVESETDRSSGRIVDQQTYELDRIEQADGARVADLLEHDRDRESRIAANQRRDALEERWRQLMAPSAPPAVSSPPPVFGSSLLSWIVDSAAIATSPPASAPAHP